MSAANALSSDHPLKAAPESRTTEPSMEDILASIRRIIADDHSRTVAAASNTFRRAATQNVTPTIPPSLSLRPERDGRPVPLDPLPAAVPTVLEMEPIEVPAEPFDEVPPARASLPNPLVAIALPHLDPATLPSALDVDLSVIAEIVNAGAAASLQTPEVAPDAVLERLGKPLLADAPVPVLSLHGYEASEEKAAEPMPPVEPLVSASAGASVESSFQALANSVFLQNAQAVDAMTRDMLRPLLKTWLDDNLPTIVERLVRTEIERVARGKRG